MAKKRKGKLALELTLAIGLPFIILNLFQAIVSIETMRKNVNADNTTANIATTKNYSKILEQSKDILLAHLDYYTNTSVIENGTTEEIVDWLEKSVPYRSQEFDYVAFVDENGDFYADNKSRTNVSTRDYFEAIMKKGQDSFIDNPVTSKTTGKTVVHLCRAVKRDGKAFGFICGVVNIEHIASILNAIEIDSNAAVFILAENGQPVAAKGDVSLMSGANSSKSTKDQGNVLMEGIIKGIKTKTGGNMWLTINKKGDKLLVTYEPITGTSWAVTIVVRGEVIEALATQLAKQLTTFSVLLGAIVFILIFILGSYFVKPLKVLDLAISDIATGNADLTKRLNVKANNEIGSVVDSFNMFTEKLQTIVSAMKASKGELVDSGDTLNQSTADTASAITEIIANIETMGTNISNQSMSVNETAGAVNEIASNIESLNRLIENQSAAVTQASSAVEEMIGNISSVSNSVSKMADQFKILENEAATGLQNQDEVARRIEVIESESESLLEANNVISSIAEQTNLLAMNAAIEAAHAGEAGKGFSVVADEIRKLSETSSSQSKTIGDELRKISEGIQQMVNATVEARKSFTNVSNGISNTNGLVVEISNSMMEQAEGSKQISLALTNMNDTSTEVQNASHEMSEGNKAILMEIQKLQDSTISMKAGMEEMSVGATQINRTGSSLSDISDNMDKSIRQIGEQVDQFKV